MTTRTQSRQSAEEEVEMKKKETEETENKEEREEIKKELCLNVMKGKWDEVVKIYKDHREAEVQGVVITLSGDTALHMAVYENEVGIVRDLMEEVTDVNTEEVMQSADNKGNTPLHLAAKMGSDKMCKYIASKKKGLIGHRNNAGETPLFLAALHGNKDAFLRLYGICCVQEDIYSWEDSRLYGYCRRSDGRNVLHCAIDGEYFDLAFQIIKRLPNFHHYVDERGHTPLHLLASKHSAFKSSCHLTWLQEIIYVCTPTQNPTVTEDRSYSIKSRHTDSSTTANGDVEKALLPKECSIFSTFIEDLLKKAVVLLISGVLRTKDLFPKHIAEMKEKHVQSTVIMKILLENASYYDYRDSGSKPTSPPNDISVHTIFDEPSDEYNHKKEGSQVSSESRRKNKARKIKKKSQKNKATKETPILIAAKNGIKEMVTGILQVFPVAIHDVNSEGKNLVLLAVENRQPHIYKLLLEKEHTQNNLLFQVDNQGNSALHLAANLKEYRPWLAPKAVLQMQWEIKWYEYIKENMPGHLLVFQNKKGKTPEALFMETHSDLVKADTEWLMKTSDSCTLVATLIATVAFATSAAVPGGVSGRNGEPVLRQQGMFEVFAISSLVALCFSLTAAIMFLAILTSRHQAMDFGIDLPRKLLIGFTALIVSIASILVSFCGGHFFVLRHVLRDARVAEYLVVFVPVAVFAIAQFPLYFKLLLATINKEPKRGFMLST